MFIWRQIPGFYFHGVGDKNYIGKVLNWGLGEPWCVSGSVTKLWVLFCTRPLIYVCADHLVLY